MSLDVRMTVYGLITKAKILNLFPFLTLPPKSTLKDLASKSAKTAIMSLPSLSTAHMLKMRCVFEVCSPLLPAFCLQTSSEHHQPVSTMLTRAVFLQADIL